MKTQIVRPVLVESKKKKDDKNYPSKIAMDNNKLFNCYSCNYSYKNAEFFDVILASLDPDEKIKTGDVYLDDSNTIRIAVTSDSDYWSRRLDYTKVIAIQDQLPPEYIKDFITQYNENRVEDIEIEMNELYLYSDGTKSKNSRLAPNPIMIVEPKFTNNYVTILLSEPNLDGVCSKCNAIRRCTDGPLCNKINISYTEEEVKKLCHLAMEYGQDKREFTYQLIDEWFNENKKK